MHFTHPHPFDPTNGYSLQQFLRIPAPPEPADFAAFWQSTWHENQSQTKNLNPTLREIEGTSSTQVFEVDYTSWQNTRIGGWITKPRNAPVTRGLVLGHGYGGREEPALEIPIQNAAAIFPCARGFGRSRQPTFPDNCERHVLAGIDTKETYIHRGCVADYWNAASALLQAIPETAPRLDYYGGSFGGGIGALALAWDKRYTKAFLDVPAFSQFPLRSQGEGWQCVGSWEFVRRHLLKHPDRREKILTTLSYFDSVSAAKYISISVLVGCALFDPAVAPAGQFAVYNALPGKKEIFVQEAGHFDWPEKPEEQSRLNARIRQWFAE